MTTTKKAKPRFTEEEQITNRIDKLKSRVELKRKKATAEDSEADELYRNPKGGSDKIAAGQKRESATRLRNRADSIERQVFNLGKKLAEFRTVTMPFLEDGSVAR